jgi:hypothetical protein
MRMGRLVGFVTQAALSAIATGATAFLYDGYFHGFTYLPPLLVASVGGAGCGVLAGARRSLPAMAAIAVAGFVVLAAELLYRPTTAAGVPTLRTLGALLGDLGQGWGRMLSVGLPADVGPALLVLPMLGSWLAAYTAAAITRWSNSPLTPAGPPLIVLVVGLLITASQPRTHFGVTAVFLLSVTVLALIRADRSVVGTPAPPATPTGQAVRRFGQAAVAVPLVAVAVLVGVASAAVLPLVASARFDPRSIDPPPVQVEEALNPLAAVKSQLRTNPPQSLLSVRVGSDDPAVDRIRLAVLDRYDGQTWTAGTKFLVAGHALTASAAAPRAPVVSLGVTLEGLAGPFLPTIGQPLEFDGVAMAGGRVGFDESSGTLVSDAPSHRGVSYRLTSVATPQNEAVTLALPAVNPADAVETLLPEGIPPELRAASDRIAGAERTPYRKLHAIEAFLRRLPYSLDVPPGHSYHALTQLVSGTEPGDQFGYSEQHAAAFAVLARAQGFPTRISVGYLLRSKKDGVFNVSTADAHSWPEVNFAGYGWTPFEPTDTTQLRPDQLKQKDPPPVPGADVPPPPQVAPALVEPLTGPKSPGRNGFARLIEATLILWLILVSLGLTLAALTIVSKTSRRRHRRRTGTPDRRVTGAWREALDRLIEQGFKPPQSATSLELAALAAAKVGERSAALTALAPLSDSATFSNRTADAHAVEQAWRLERQVAQALIAGRLRWARQLRALADPRPLLFARTASRARLRALRWLGVDQL